MEKKTIEVLADTLAELTLVTSKIYMDVEGEKVMSKKMWAFLHIGYMTALMNCGYTDKEADEVVSLAHHLLLRPNKDVRNMNDNDKHLRVCRRCDNAEVCYSHQWLCMKHQPERVGYGIGCPDHAHEPDPEEEFDKRAIEQGD